MHHGLSFSPDCGFSRSLRVSFWFSARFFTNFCYPLHNPHSAESRPRTMAPRKRFIAALERRPLTGRVPYFELVFFLTMEAFGRVHPLHRSYAQWDQMEEKERNLHHALHSLDLQAGVDIAAVKRTYVQRVCLIGNVNCGLLQSGTPEAIEENVRYALHHGMPGGGYIFSTSNCVYTGLPLSRYELMLNTWKQKGNYPD
jgi:hypothetical protein